MVMVCWQLTRRRRAWYSTARFTFLLAMLMQRYLQPQGQQSHIEGMPLIVGNTVETISQTIAPEELLWSELPGHGIQMLFI